MTNLVAAAAATFKRRGTRIPDELLVGPTDEFARDATKDHPGGEVLVYETPDGDVRVDVRPERETVWLSLNQIAEVFGRDKSVISRDLRNVFRSGELEREAVCARNATTETGSGGELMAAEGVV